MKLQELDRGLSSAPRRYVAERGRCHPLGAHPDADGINFAFFSEHATGMQLLLFDAHDATEPFQTIVLDPEAQPQFRHLARVRARAARAGLLRVAGLRAAGRRGPRPGHRFDPEKVLIDPYARGLDRTLWVRGSALRAR